MKKLPVKIKWPFVVMALAVLAFQVYQGELPPPTVDSNASNSVDFIDYSEHIPPARARHILGGDHRGGGHRYGTGKPCKSEFPADWDDSEILEATARIAANDNLNWQRQDNGYFVTEKMVEGVRVRVVLGRDKESVVTAYPTNVARNPCPANDR